MVFLHRLALWLIHQASIHIGLFRSRLLRAVCLRLVNVREIGRALGLNGTDPPHQPTPGLLSLNLQGIKSAVKPNWKTNGFVQWEAASINPHLMWRRKDEAETGEFAALREAIHYFSGEVESRRKGQDDEQMDVREERGEDGEDRCCYSKMQAASGRWCSSTEI